jgi:hypothetical protein
VESERYYTDYYQQEITDAWNYTYHQDWYWEVNFYGDFERRESTLIEFKERTEYEWSETVSAAEVAETNESAKRVYGDPPANAVVTSTFSLNDKNVYKISTLDNGSISAEILINPETFNESKSVEQQIIYKSVQGLIAKSPLISEYEMPMDDISDDDVVAMLKLANEGSNEYYKYIATLDQYSVEAELLLELQLQNIEMLKELKQQYDKIINLEKRVLSKLEELQSKTNQLNQLTEIHIGQLKELNITYDQLGEVYDKLLISSQSMAALNEKTIDRVFDTHEATLATIEALNNALQPISDATDQLISGKYSDKVTVGGTAAQITAGLLGVDLAGDFRDLTHDIQNWEWTWGHAGETLLDGVGIIPIIGAVKYGDEVVSLNKACNCFTAGIKVLTDEGEKPIEEIEVGDKVLAKDDETGEMAYKEVEWLFQRDVEETYNITVGDEVITTTDEHPFWIVGKGWVEAKNLVVGDILITSDGKELAIEKIEVKKEHVTVYNFKVKDFHTYFVSNLGIWTHNSCGFKTGDKTPGGLEFTTHGALRANERGFNAQTIDNIVNNNKKNRVSKVDGEGKKTWEYTDFRGNKVVTNENGGIVSVHSPAEGGVYIPKPPRP